MVNIVWTIISLFNNSCYSLQERRKVLVVLVDHDLSGHHLLLHRHRHPGQPPLHPQQLRHDHLHCLDIEEED